MHRKCEAFMLLMINVLSLLMLAAIALQTIFFAFLMLVPTITVLNAAASRISALVRVAQRPLQTGGAFRGL